jgi:hypothetical protein
MPLETVPVEPAAQEHAALWQAGTPGAGEFRCSTCRYGIAISAVLPSCPMCGGEEWELVARRPLPGVVALDA